MNKAGYIFLTLMVFTMVPSVLRAEPPVEEWEKSIVRVWNDTQGGRGTGWVVNNESYVVTNQHVVAGGTEFSVQLAGTEPSDSLPAELVWADQRLDLAVLRVPGYEAPPFKLHVEDPDRGIRVYTAGYPGLADDAAETLTNQISIYGGTVALVVDQPRTNRRIIQHDNIVNAGNSGGPLLDDCGRVLGLTSYGRESEGIQADFVWYSIHIMELARELDRLGIAYEVDNTICDVAGDGGSGVSGEQIGEIEEDIRDLGGNVSNLDSDFGDLERFVKAYGALLAGALVILLVLVLRKPRERIVRIIERVSKKVRNSISRRKPLQKAKATPKQMAGPGLVMSGFGSDGRTIRIELVFEVLECSGKGMSIGRDTALVDFALNDDRISRRHARLSIEDDSIVLEDLNSTNGTQINGKTLMPYTPQEIAPGDIIRFGSLELSVAQK
jgi:Trypsin-like peptidase domain/FHA domain